MKWQKWDGETHNTVVTVHYTLYHTTAIHDKPTAVNYAICYAE